MRLRRKHQREDAKRQEAAAARSLLGLDHMKDGIAVLSHVRRFAHVVVVGGVVADGQVLEKGRGPRRLADGAFGEPVVGALGTAFGAREVGHGVR